MNAEAEDNAVAVLHRMVISHWHEFHQPLLLSTVGQEFLKANIDYPRKSNTKLKDFVVRTGRKGGYILVDHPNFSGHMGIIPSHVDPDEAIWLSPIERESLGSKGSTTEKGLGDILAEALRNRDRELIVPSPVENVPSAFGYAWSASFTLVLESSSANFPHFPFSSSERDHRKRLQTCRTLASDLVSEVSTSLINIRPEYKLELTKYVERLPSDASEGNIILADAAARTLRSLFSAEMNLLPTAFAASLKTLLEQHIGLRPYYAELEALYRDVRSGRLEEPLSLDAVDGVITTIREYTPEVFDRSVAAALGDSTVPPTVLEPDTETPPAENQPTPPPDPMGELDPNQSHDYQVAGVINRLWQVFMVGEKLRKAGAAWREIYEAMAPNVSRILEWLHNFVAR